MSVPPTSEPVTDDCVYTIVEGKQLSMLTQRGCPEPIKEKKRWVTARRLWLRAVQNKVAMPVLFADATQCDRLLYWGVLTELIVAEDGTEYTVDRLRPIRGRYTPQTSCCAARDGELPRTSSALTRCAERRLSSSERRRARDGRGGLAECTRRPPGPDGERQRVSASPQVHRCSAMDTVHEREGDRCHSNWVSGESTTG